MICSAGAQSPSENSEVAVTTSGGKVLSVATWAAAIAAFWVSADDAVDALQHAPAHRQGGIDVHRPQQRVDGGRRVFQRHVAEAAFLMQPAEAGPRPFQAVEHRQGLGEALQVAKAVGRDQQQIAIFREIAQQRLGVPQGFRVPALRLQRPQPADFQLGWR